MADEEQAVIHPSRPMFLIEVRGKNGVLKAAWSSDAALQRALMDEAKEHEAEEMDKALDLVVEVRKGDQLAPNAPYTIICPDGSEIKGITDESGRYIHRGLPPGQYRLVPDGDDASGTIGSQKQQG